MIDLRDIESKRNGRGHVLRCPRCGEFAPRLLIVDTGELICKRCWRLIGEQVDALSLPIIRDY